MIRASVPIAIAAAIVAAGSFVGCSDSTQSVQCVSDRIYFEREVWGKFMGQSCSRCHTPGGPAVDQGARFVLQPSTFPNFIDANMAVVKEMAKYDYQGKKLILEKPLGRANHGGGQIFNEGSEESNALKAMLARMEGAPTQCSSQNSILSNVAMLSPAETFRKAAIDLGGRLPTAEENATIEAGGEPALDAALDKLLKEDLFLDRVRELYNDMVLTDRALQYGGAALNFTDDEFFPALKPFKDPMNGYNDPRRPNVNKAIAREPLDLIAYVVKNDRPFTEVVTAPYAVVNPFTALAYGVNTNFTDPTNYNEFKEAQVQMVNVGQMKKTVQVPHAGVLSTPSFLNRWQTTPTNRNRGRARRVYKFFLATDVLRIAERPVDASQLTSIDNPTRNSVYCNVCHNTLDPMAGGFRGFDDNNYEEFDGNREWHNDMVLPGFEAQKMDSSDYSKAVQWLGKAIAQDPRFGISAAHVAFQGLTGRKPLAYPTDPKAANYNERIEAWEAQDEFFQRVVADWNAQGQNFKVIVKAIIKSPYYRGASWTLGGEGGALAARLQDIGVGQLLTPEGLSRKIKAVTGYVWTRSYDKTDVLRSDYNIFYGGLDSDSVISRTTSPNGIMANVAQRMANEVACRVTATDFTRPRDQRRLFRFVEKDQVPTVDAVMAIKQNIQYLHELVLGEKLPIDHPEIERTYQVFFESWKEYDQTTGDDNLVYECQGRNDPSTGQALPANQQVTTDRKGAVRSWQAVMTYLLSDFKFLHQ